MCSSPLGNFTGPKRPNTSYALMKLWYWTLRSGSLSSLRSIACSLRSAERRDDPSCLGFSWLEVWQQIFHLILGLCVWRNVVQRLVALSSLWIAPRVPLPRSGLGCALDCCLLWARMYVVVPSVWKELESDQKVPSQELSLVELDSCQNMSACLIAASRRICQLQLISQCFLVDQIVRQPTWCP